MMNDRISIARNAMSPAWDRARSDRVLESAVRARHARARRQRWTMIAAAAAVFVLAAHSFASPSFRMSSQSPAQSAQATPGADDDLVVQTTGAVAMSSDAFADANSDGGRETD